METNLSQEKVIEHESLILKRLENSRLIEKIGDNSFKLKYRLLNQLQRTRLQEGPIGIGSGGMQPNLYAATELYLIVCLSENPNSFISFLEQWDKKEGSCYWLEPSAYFNDQRDTLIDHPIYRHDYGYGLPENITAPLKSKQILFIGGGYLNKSLLCRYFSDGATAVNIDPYVGFDTRINDLGKTHCLIDKRYNQQSARELKTKFGYFNAIVIQNVFDYGSVYDSDEIREMITPLHMNVSVGGLLLISTYNISQDNKKLIIQTLQKQGFIEKANLDEMASIKTGEFKVYERVSENHK